MADWPTDDPAPLMLSVRADTQAFAGDVAQLRTSLEGSLGQGAAKAGNLIESSLVRAVTSGKLGFDTLRTTALSALDSIAASALKIGLNALIGGPGGGSGGALTFARCADGARTGGCPIPASLAKWRRVDAMRGTG